MFTFSFGTSFAATGATDDDVKATVSALKDASVAIQSAIDSEATAYKSTLQTDDDGYVVAAKGDISTVSGKVSKAIMEARIDKVAEDAKNAFDAEVKKVQTAVEKEGTTASVWMGESKGCCPNIGRCISISNGSRQQTLRKLKIWIKITDRFISACYFYGTTQIEKASVLSFVVTHLWTGTFYAPPDVFSLKSSNILSSRSISSFSGFFVNSDFTRESKRELSVKSSRKD